MAEDEEVVEKPLTLREHLTITILLFIVKVIKPFS